MEQPRFKFGDKIIPVVESYKPVTIEVKSIEWRDDWSGYCYNGSWGESDCSLYQEPVKRKLEFFGYRVRGSTGILYSPFEALERNNEMLVRSPGHDTEYEVCPNA